MLLNWPVGLKVTHIEKYCLGISRRSREIGYRTENELSGENGCRMGGIRNKEKRSDQGEKRELDRQVRYRHLRNTIA